MKLQGGGPRFVGAKSYAVGLFGLAVVAIVFLTLTVTDVFQLTDGEAFLAAVFGVMAALLFIFAMSYGLNSADPVPVERRTVAYSALLPGLVYGIVAISVGLGAFAPATTDARNALAASTGAVGAVLLIYSVYMALPAN